MTVALSTHELTRTFRSGTAVDGLTFDVRRGEIFGFLGPNGAGKTTTLHLLLGLLRPSSGTAVVLGHDVRTEGHRVRRRTGALLEHHGLYERLTAEENLLFQARVHRFDRAAAQARIRELLEPLQLYGRRKENVSPWSKGMKQKLAIARAVFHRPELVFLDEPTAAHDPVAAAALREDLVALAREQGVTVFLTTHNLFEAERVCDRVALVRKGRLLAVNRPSELVTEPVPRLEVLLRQADARALQAAKRVPGVAMVTLHGSTLRVDLSDPGAGPEVVRALAKAGVDVEEVHRVRPSLEKAFLDLVRESRT